jgi:hypothetical protein
MRQLSTGATAAAVGSPVGFIADKRLMGGQTFDAFVAGQPESYTNAATDFVFANGSVANGTNSITLGRVPGTNQNVQFTPPVVGTWYTLSFDVVAYDGSLSGITGVDLGITDNFASLGIRIQTTGSFNFVVPIGVRIVFQQLIDNRGCRINNLSIKEVPGNHFLQATAGNRPILGVEPAGGRRNLSVYTEQFNNASWIKTGVTITPDATVAPDGTVTADRLTGTGGAATFRSVQETVASAGVGRVFSVYVKADTQNFVQLLFNGTAASWANFDLSSGVIGSGGTNGTPTITDVGNGWFRCSISTTLTTVQGGRVVPVTSTTSVRAETNTLTTSLFIWGAQLENGSTATDYQRVTDQWNVTEAGVPDCYYVAFDGTDDWLQSAATINPGAVDKAQVFAGVRKLSDAAVGILVESSATTQSNAGSFYLSAPDTIGANYGFRSGGGVRPSSTIVSTYTSPITNTATGLFDIAGDTLTARINGAQVAQNTADQGTGNFLTYTHYIGRRGGTTLPYNGRVYQTVMRFGPNLTADQITQTETFVNSKTGAF